MKHEQKEVMEVYLGGAISLIATVIIIIQCVREGFSIDSILNGLVSLAQVIVAALVLLVALRSILSRRKPTETFASTFGTELQGWVARNRPLILPEPDFSKHTRFSMLTNHNHIFDVGDNLEEASKNKKGRFVDMPHDFQHGFKKGDEILFYLNKSTFLERAKMKNRDIASELEVVALKISNCINANFSDMLTASVKNGPNDTAIVNIILLRELQTPEDGRRIVHLLDYVTTLFMVAA